MRTSVKTATNKSQLYGASRNNRKNNSLSFNDKRSSTAQLKKIQESANTQSPVQFVKPKPLSEMVVDRTKGDTDHARESHDEVFRNAPDEDTQHMRAYQEARDNNLGLNDLTLSKENLEVVPEIIGMLPVMLKEALDSSENDNDRAYTFRQRFFKTFNQNTTLDKVAKYAYKRMMDISIGEAYLNQLKHEDQNFNFNLIEEDIQYRTPKEGLFGPSQSSLDMATQIANRILREAFQSQSQEERFFKIATGVGAGLDSSNDTARVASKILEDYLKPKLMDFIYKLPLSEGGNDEVWEGDTLNSNVVDNEGVQLPQDDTWVRPKVQEAWDNISNIVSPAVLNYTGKAGVKVDGLVGRAFYRTEEKMIHLNKVTSSKATVMHEFGHHLENHSKVPHWIKLHQLMRDRSNGTDLKKIVPFTIPFVISGDEMRYDTDLPASGEMGGCMGYNVKYYDHGSTEVVSTALEVFHNREKAYRIAVKDPGMFLAVMGVLRGR